ncbi:MAG: LamG domain-containing protein [Victivallaceae bacterium]
MKTQNKTIEPAICWRQNDKPEISAESFSPGEQLTVIAWLESQGNCAEKMQAAVSKWKVNEAMEAFDAYDAGNTDGLDVGGFLGAVFDGRYVYFSPQHNTKGRCGNVLRYDTHSGFHDPAGWQAYDADGTDGLSTKGFYGGVFDGRYVYFTPRNDGKEYHTRVLRYDTQGDFKSCGSWQAYATGLGTTYQGAGFDGRYVYFAPGTANKTGQSGTMLRYDTKAAFKDIKSYETCDIKKFFPGKTVKDFDGVAFAGKYVYFVPLKFNTVVRYNTEENFNDADAWQAFDAAGLGMKYCVGSTFDGQYLYFVPYDNNAVVRYDINRDFENAASWESFDVGKISDNKAFGYDGAFFDGKFIYFIPFFYTDKNKKMNFHGQIIRCDTTKPFGAASSWETKDISNVAGLKTVGYNAGIFDGRYFYCAPWHDGEAYHSAGKIVGHGRVLRYDSTGNNSSFVLKYSDYGHNGGLSGALPGPSFIINTDKGSYSVSANQALPAGKHQLTGVYDGKSIRLYIDGKLINEAPARGKICENAAPVVVGNISGGNTAFEGIIEKVEIFYRALSLEQIKKQL